jgi:hypothetical protein
VPKIIRTRSKESRARQILWVRGVVEFGTSVQDLLGVGIVLVTQRHVEDAIQWQRGRSDVLPNGADGSFRVRVGLGIVDDWAAPARLGPARERGRDGLLRRICPKVEAGVGRRCRLFGGEVPIRERENVTPAGMSSVVVAGCSGSSTGEKGFRTGEQWVGPVGICSSCCCSWASGNWDWRKREDWDRRHLKDERRVRLVLCPSVTSESSR